jgi:gamma-glutamyl:cysteine ligase YbdK (ATP-grasp superfamily)
VGLEISKDGFDESEFEAFQRKLEVDLAALGSLLDRPGLGEGVATIGAEVELNLIDERARPAPVNGQLLQRVADPRLSLEINRYNVEVNARPLPLVGASLAAMETELRDVLTKVRAAARDLGARVVRSASCPPCGRRTSARP